MKLNLGSGPVAVSGWTNVDRSPNILLGRLPGVKATMLRMRILNAGHAADWDQAIVRGDIRALTYPDDSADAVYSSHVLEHIYLDEAKQVLSEAYRVLKPGGLIRLALPDGAKWARELINANDEAEAGIAYNRRLLAHPEGRPGFMARLRDLAGGHIHRWQPTVGHVSEMLREAGFHHVTRLDFREGQCPDLDVIETREESFFLEAAKPAVDV